MFDKFRSLLLRVLCVPHAPSPPAGAPGSIRVFQAGANLYKLRFAGWALGQGFALLGLLSSFAFLLWLKHDLAAQGSPVNPPPAAISTIEKSVLSRSKPPRRSFEQRISQGLPGWVFPALTAFKIVSCVAYLVQFAATYAALRLDYELRWYVVTDRSLRIRTGLLNVQETTMSFANLQQVVVTQGPVQRLLRVADVCVQSAGGGGKKYARPDQSMHTGIFHGVENAQEIRDLILDRLRQFRAAGLGDPEDRCHPSAIAPASPPDAVPSPADTLVAARELLAETRALRRALAG